MSPNSFSRYALARAAARIRSRERFARTTFVSARLDSARRPPLNDRPFPEPVEGGSSNNNRVLFVAESRSKLTAVQHRTLTAPDVGTICIVWYFPPEACEFAVLRLVVVPFASNRQGRNRLARPSGARGFASTVEVFSQENPTDQREVREDPC